MKKIVSVFIGVLAAAFILAGCSDLINESAALADGRGVVTVTVGGGKTGRTLLPVETDRTFYYELIFTPQPAGEKIVRKVGVKGSDSCELLPGDWTVDVNGFNTEADAEAGDKEKAVVTGSKNFKIDSGKQTKVTVGVIVNADKLLSQNGNGTLAYSFTLPAGADGDFSIVSTGQNGAMNPVTLTPGDNSDEIPLDSDSYYITVSVRYDGKEKTWREIAHIYDDTVTKAEKVFNINDFTASSFAEIIQFGIKEVPADFVKINEGAITVYMPSGTNFSSLTPDIKFNGAMIKPAPGKTKDFTSPVTYTVSTESGTGKDYTVTVMNSVLERIAVTKLPKKTDYFVGDTKLELDGLEVTATYNYGDKKIENNALEITGFSSTTDGTIPITVTYSEGGIIETDTFDIFVKKSLKEIEVTNPPDKKDEYYLGGPLDLTGLEVTATYDDGSKNVIDYPDTNLKFIEDLNTVTSSSGEKEITVTYGGKSDTFTVTVNAVVLKDIAVTKNPADTVYYEGDTIPKLAGLEVTATYNYGPPKTIFGGDNGITVSELATVTTSPGKKKITVTYGGYNDTFEITVKAVELVSIKVTKKPTKTDYFVGAPIELAGLEVTATYNNGSPDVISYPNTNFSFSGLDTATASPGTIPIKVTYGGKDATFDITVKAIELDSIKVTKNPTDTVYYVGDTIPKLAGLEVTATYNNGDNKTKLIGDNGITVSELATVTSSPGEKKEITVTYVEGEITKTDKFYITVKAVVLESIAITKEPKKTYKINELLDLTGLEVTATYNNSSTKKILNGDTALTVFGFDSSVAGEKDLTVEYFDGGVRIRTKFKITVNKSLQSIAVKDKPTKIGPYYVGDTIELAGLVVTATYDDGTTADITYSDTDTNFSFSDLKAAVAGEKIVPVTYADMEATFTITVYPKSGITLDENALVITDEGKELAIFNITSLVLSRAAGDTQTFTLDDPEYTNFVWRFGNNVLGTANSFTLKARAFGLGKRTLTLTFTKNGKPWFASLDFTVVE